MAHEPDTIQSVYAQRIAADLENNRGTQDEINQQITELQTRLRQLREDEKWLSGIQGSVPPSADTPTAALPAAPTTAPDAPETPQAAEAAVPQPRHDDALKPARARKSPAKKAAATKATTQIAKAAPAKPAAKKAAATKAAPAKKSVPQQAEPATKTAEAAAAEAPAKKTAQPPLRELVEAILARHAGEPRMVNEIRSELDATHPERSTSTQVVRNALESLTKKGLVNKGTQQGSVMYTKPTPSAADADLATAADSATSPAEDNTKVPAGA
ncbi:hypothetical protein ACH4M4_37930 [Streptomyces sp. NPDC017254]|uniref:hypothetical protein n=1 Tax=unclassified Streptomyces TaxID=2593676 RepID=UPI003798306D